MLAVLLCAYLVFMVITIYGLWRNDQVFNFRMRRAEEASRCARYVIDVSQGDCGTDYLIPYDRLNRVSYEHMLESVHSLEFFINDDWLDDIYQKYEQIANAKRVASVREKLLGQELPTGTIHRHLEADQQGRLTGDVGRGEVEQG